MVPPASATSVRSPLTRCSVRSPSCLPAASPPFVTSVPLQVYPPSVELAANEPPKASPLSASCTCTGTPGLLLSVTLTPTLAVCPSLKVDWTEPGTQLTAIAPASAPPPPPPPPQATSTDAAIAIAALRIVFDMCLPPRTIRRGCAAATAAGHSIGWSHGTPSGG